MNIYDGADAVLDPEAIFILLIHISQTQLGLSDLHHRVRENFIEFLIVRNSVLHDRSQSVQIAPVYYHIGTHSKSHHVVHGLKFIRNQSKKNASPNRHGEIINVLEDRTLCQIYSVESVRQ